MEPFGLLVVNKPVGLTSRRVVDRVQGLVTPAKAGHAGTLDPLARGVLVVCVGRATRLTQYIQNMPKRYQATFLLGRESDSGDTELPVNVLPDVPCPDARAVSSACKSMVGRVMQRPPAFSAVKVRGRRAYALARSGVSVELPSRSVHVYKIEVVCYQYPELTLDIRCGSGTYVRSLGRDLAATLDTRAVMSALVRTSVGDFHIGEACDLEWLSLETLEKFTQPAVRAVASLPTLELTEEDVHRLANGGIVQKKVPENIAEFAALDGRGRLMAILARHRHGGLVPVRNFFRTYQLA